MLPRYLALYVFWSRRRHDTWLITVNPPGRGFVEFSRVTSVQSADRQRCDFSFQATNKYEVDTVTATMNCAVIADRDRLCVTWDCYRTSLCVYPVKLYPYNRSINSTVEPTTNYECSVPTFVSTASQARQRPLIDFLLPCTRYAWILDLKNKTVPRKVETLKLYSKPAPRSRYAYYCCNARSNSATLVPWYTTCTCSAVGQPMSYAILWSISAPINSFFCAEISFLLILIV